MSQLDLDTLRHAVTTAKKTGLRVVRLKLADSSFSAVLGEADEVEEVVEVEVASKPTALKITSPVVGYLRTQKKFEPGQKIEIGDVVGEIVALGIANDVVSKHAGQIAEVHAVDGDALEFGQNILTLERL